MKKRKLSAFTALLLAAVLLLTACSGSSDTTDDTSDASADVTASSDSAAAEETSSEDLVTVNIAAETNSLGYYQSVADANGLAEEIGVDLNWIGGLNTGPENIAAITGGSVDIAVIGDFPVVTTQGNEGADFVVIGYTETADSALFVPADSGITDVADLEGLTIGTQAGTGAQLLLQTALEDAGLTTDDVEIVYLDQGSWQSAFISGEIDAMSVIKYSTIANDEIGEVTYLAETGYALNSILADRTWAEENPEAVARTLLVLSAVWDCVEEDEDAAVEAVLENYDVSDEQIRFIFDNINNTILEPFSETQVARYEEIKEFALSIETIETDFDVEDIYTNDYIELANELAAE